MTQYHKYNFFGELRTYKYKLTLVTDNVIYLGTCDEFINHWGINSKKKEENKIIKVTPVKSLIPDNFKVVPENNFKPVFYTFEVNGKICYFTEEVSLSWFNKTGDKKVAYKGIRFGLPTKSITRNFKTVNQGITKYNRTCCYCNERVTNNIEKSTLLL